MTQPKKEPASVIQASASPSYYVVFAIKVALVLIILLLMPKLVEGKRRRSTDPQTAARPSSRVELRVLRKECMNNQECSSMIPEERMNCFFQCLSESCYDKIFGDMPLEDGEVDYDRYRLFERCLKQDIWSRNENRKNQIMSK
ncbi:hypothetical protein ACA910_019285 [Epithemia clementina (nom. ined.)]